MRKHRWRLWRVACWPLILIIPAYLAVAAAVPGPHRVVCPLCYGLRAIGQRVFVGPTFTARDEDSLRDAIATGRAKAVAYSWYAIRMAPGGLNPTNATPELIHIELHWRLGAIGLRRPYIPAWFDERLAVVLPGDKSF